VANFDRLISPGGEGKITLNVSLQGYQGSVQKSATVFSNDPQNPRLTLTVKGKIRSLVELDPAGPVYFRGLASQLEERSINIISKSQPFQITKLESSLTDKVGYRLETIEAGKHYRLFVKNLVKTGQYNGSITLLTDMPQKPQILVHVAGNIEGEISVRPPQLVVGKLAPDQPARLGKVLVMSNSKQAFKITKIDYDSNFIEVSQQPLAEGGAIGYSIDVKPRMENIPADAKSRKELVMFIETDLNPQEKHQVKIFVVNQ